MDHKALVTADDHATHGSAPEQYFAFQQRIEHRYPEAFTDAAWQLHRIITGSPESRVTPWRRALLPFGLVKLALRGQLRLPEAELSDVLVTFFPARSDYWDLLAPAVEEASRRGARVSVALPPVVSSAPQPLGSAPAFKLSSFASPLLYGLARRREASLRAPLSDFVNEFGLDAEQRASALLLLQAYSWQLELLAAALRSIKPAVVLGIHFMLNPGFVGALREAGRRGSRTPTLLLQHGVFSHTWETHDFIGADKVLVWGARAAAELDLFPGVKPQAKVVGNPRLEVLAALAKRVEPGSRQTLLVLGTNDTATPERQRDALRMVAEALPTTAARSVLYRPHPSEPREPYDELIASGAISEAQVQRAGTVHEALLRADLVVGTTSTTMLEAITLGVPAIQVLPERFEVDWHTAGMITASTPEQLTELALAILSSATSRSAALELERSLARDLLGEPAGAAKRIADAVLAELAAPALE